MTLKKTYRAFVVDRDGEKLVSGIQELDISALPDADVKVRVQWSSLNYKDGLAITGAAPIIRKTPMTAGIDFSGIVEESAIEDFVPGDEVVLTGWGVGETHPGGFAQLASVQGDWLEKLPDGLGPKNAMAVGTAGLTSMLCVMGLENNGLKPSSGPVIVTGAAGGVGSLAVAILSDLGYEVSALTGRKDYSEFLTNLGAKEIIGRNEFSEEVSKPLLSERWAGAVDVVGGKILAKIISQMKYGAPLAACGLAGGSELNTTVLPFILRGVKLIGIDSVMCPKPLRVSAWDRIAKQISKEKLSSITNIHSMSDLDGLGKDILSGATRGRIVIDVNK